MKTIDRQGIDSLLAILRQRGYRVVGPTVRDQAIVYDDLGSADDLPAGWTAEQDGGRYRLRRRDDGALFGFAGTPQSWKRYLYPPRVRLWRALKGGRRNPFEIERDEHDGAPLALFGVRGCDLAAIAVQDRVLLGGDAVDPIYRSRRESALIVAVQCTAPGGTCFCASMGTGPEIDGGHDLCLTELLSEEDHLFLVESGTDRGAEILAELGGRDAEAGEIEAGERAVREAAGKMGRSLETEGIQDLFRRSYEHPRWEEVAQRCLACGNCTQVCPTCFCHTVEDAGDLAGESTERWRRWDSCFTGEFSYIHGGSIRVSRASRYRQWITHKLSTWHEQFGTSGCVGCGRCITWCPVGIDITEEARVLRQGDRAMRSPGEEAR